MEDCEGLCKFSRVRFFIKPSLLLLLPERRVCPRVVKSKETCPKPDHECESDINCGPGTKCCPDSCGELTCEVPVKPSK